MLNIEKIRADFTLLDTIINNKKLVYFDNAATNQKPKSVIDKTNYYYNSMNSNIHRGAHHLANISTIAYEETRSLVSKFINSHETEEIIFTSGTTASLNLLAYSFGERYISEGDNIIISEMEHHANIVPWQLMCKRKNAELRVIPVTDSGELDYNAFKSLIDVNTKIVSITLISNVLGTENDIKTIIEIAHSLNIPVCIDAAQAMAHKSIDVQSLDCDFLAFSAHKMYGPTGVGVLYGKSKYLDEMPPFMSGGEMIKSVSFDKTTFNSIPYKFEPGTPNIAGVIAFSEAIKYINEIGIDDIYNYETELINYTKEKLAMIEGIVFYGPLHPSGSISFNIKGIHHYDLGVLLDQMGIAVRTGHHCAQPLMKRFSVEGMVRVSIALYNTRAEIDYLLKSLDKAVKLLK